MKKKLVLMAIIVLTATACGHFGGVSSPSSEKAEATKVTETPAEVKVSPSPTPEAIEKTESKPTYKTMFVVNCEESTPLRSSPSNSAAEITQIPLGEAVSYVETAENGYYKIIYNGDTGYALAAHLNETYTGGSKADTQKKNEKDEGSKEESKANPADNTKEKPSESKNDNASQKNYKTLYVVNCEESITLRTSPSTSAEEIRQIPLGASVSYVEPAENGFYKVIYNGDTGYALASYLSETNTGGAEAPEQPASEPFAEWVNYGDSLWVVLCKESISLRSEPSTSSEALLQIPLFDSVKYLGDASNGFVKVEYNGVTGYALREYLDEYEPQIAIRENRKVVNCNESISLRESPSTSAEALCQIPLGATVFVISDSANGFYKVEYDGMTGYALAEYLSYE